MPTRPYFAADLDDSKQLLEAATMLAAFDDSDCEEAANLLVLAAAEPAVKRLKQDIGAEKLSLKRLFKEAEAKGLGGDDLAWNVYHDYGFHLAELPTVIRALQVPDKVKLRRNVFTGEECVLLLLRRLKTCDGLLSLTKEAGRCIGQISQAVNWALTFIRER